MKVGIIGAGMVGSSAAFAIALRGVASEVVLIDRNTALAEAQAQDVLHATPFAYGTRVQAGSYSALAGAGAVILTAGVSQKPGESRLDLLARNEAVFADIIPKVRDAAPDAVLIIATNPCDIMTAIATRLSGLPSSRCFGSGTILDTARFRTLLAGHLGVSPTSVHAPVLGEHGDSEVLCWSAAIAGTIGVADLAEQLGRPLTPEIRQKIDDGVRRAADTIIAGKSATWYGIGGGLARIIQAISNDQGAILTVSRLEKSVEGVGPVALSLPRVITGQGIVKTVWPVLSQDEHTLLRKSAQVLVDAGGPLIGDAGTE